MYICICIYVYMLHILLNIPHTILRYIYSANSNLTSSYNIFHWRLEWTGKATTNTDLDLCCEFLFLCRYLASQTQPACFCFCCFCFRCFRYLRFLRFLRFLHFLLLRVEQLLSLFPFRYLASRLLSINPLLFFVFVVFSIRSLCLRLTRDPINRRTRYLSPDDVAKSVTEEAPRAHCCHCYQQQYQHQHQQQHRQCRQISHG